MSIHPTGMPPDLLAQFAAMSMHPGGAQQPAQATGIRQAANMTHQQRQPASGQPQFAAAASTDQLLTARSSSDDEAAETQQYQQPHVPIPRRNARPQAVNPGYGQAQAQAQPQTGHTTMYASPSQQVAATQGYGQLQTLQPQPQHRSPHPSAHQQEVLSKNTSMLMHASHNNDGSDSDPVKQNRELESENLALMVDNRVLSKQLKRAQRSLGRPRTVHKDVPPPQPNHQLIRLFEAQQHNADYVVERGEIDARAALCVDAVCENLENAGLKMQDGKKHYLESRAQQYVAWHNGNDRHPDDSNRMSLVDIINQLVQEFGPGSVYTESIEEPESQSESASMASQRLNAFAHTVERIGGDAQKYVNNPASWDAAHASQQASQAYSNSTWQQPAPAPAAPTRLSSARAGWPRQLSNVQPALVGTAQVPLNPHALRSMPVSSQHSQPSYDPYGGSRQLGGGAGYSEAWRLG